VSQKSKMLKSFGILVMRRLMRQIAKKVTPLKSDLKTTKSIIKVSQKGMTYETLLVGN